MSGPSSVDDDRPPPDQPAEPAVPEPPAPGPQPDFGPSGYLPPRAAQRARKIVLRAPLGLQWVVAAVVAGVVVVAAALLFLQSSSGAPGPPYEPVDALTALPDLLVTTVAGEDVAVLTAGGRPRAFDVGDGPSGLRYCPGPNRLVADDGRMWLPTGRGLDGIESLREHPVVAHDGVLYVDVSRTTEGPPPSGEDPGSPDCG